MTTGHDVAKAAGVSQATVSRALAGDPRVAPETRERIEREAQRLGYRPDAAARNLATHRSWTVGVVVDDLRNPFFTELIDVVHTELLYGGFHTVLLDDREAMGVRDLPGHLIGEGLDGVVFVSARTGSKGPDQAAAMGLPVVLLNRETDGGHPSIDRVVSDNLLGGRLAGEHLLGLGHRRIALISGPSDTSTARDREQGFTDALKDAGLPLDPTLRREGPYSHHTGSQWAAELLAMSDPPTAIFCGNDVIGVGALDGAKRLRKAVPGDVSIIGYDDVEIAGWRTMALSTVRQPLDQMARAATRMLLHRATNGDTAPGRKQIFPAGLVQRSSTAHLRAPGGAGDVRPITGPERRSEGRRATDRSEGSSVEPA